MTEKKKRGRKPAVSREDQALIRELYNLPGYTYAAVARRLRLSPAVVTAVINRSGPYRDEAQPS